MDVQQPQNSDQDGNARAALTSPALEDPSHKMGCFPGSSTLKKKKQQDSPERPGPVCRKKTRTWFFPSSKVLPIR